ncbi:MAG: S8 family serine peptidase, partial [Thermoleophilaceae bacterium]
NAATPTAWETTTGRPDVTIAVLDSGIKWNDHNAMVDLRRKVRLNKGELPFPEVTGSCPGYSQDGSTWDVNDDGVFNVDDYACDPRVDKSHGDPALLDPKDLIDAFSNGTDQDGNGFVDDIAGWDFLQNDNDPYDDVQYGHGTGEAMDSNAEANNGADQTGSCPNCTVIPLRVGDSFIADVNNFAQAVLYAVDNDASVVQEALGTLNMSKLGRDAVEYAYDHGVAVIASAADEAAQHHNWPSSYPHTIVVNSVVKYDDFSATKSYVEFNGCTNFSTHVTLAIPSSSCSSNATGVGAGLAGLIYSEAKNVGVTLTVNQVRQLMASGTVDGKSLSDDVSFMDQGNEPNCNPPVPGCTDPSRGFDPTFLKRTLLDAIVNTKPYPARPGYDEFYGYGRADTAGSVRAVAAKEIPPEAEITSPEWYSQVDSSAPSVAVKGHVGGSGNGYTCVVEAAPGSEPDNSSTADGGDFQKLSSSWCDGSTAHSGDFDGTLASIDVSALKARFPAGTNFNGPDEPPLTDVHGGPTKQNNRPGQEPFGFTVRVVVTAKQGAHTLTGQDRRNLYLHKDADLMSGFPIKLPSDGASSPAFADLDGDNKNELIFGTSDGTIHALRPNGSELPGWPVRTDPMPLHTSGKAFASHEVSPNDSRGAVLASVAVGDLNHDGVPEVVAADMKGKVYAWGADGKLEWKREANPAYATHPLGPFANPSDAKRYRTQHAFVASPVLADLDGDGKLEVVAASMDRNVYAWHADGSGVSGFPAVVVDQSKVSSVDPQTHVPTFKPDSDIGDPLDQGAIVDTPAIADLDGDGKPEIVVGTNESYPDDKDGGLNAGLTSASIAALSNVPGGPLSFANTRVYALHSNGSVVSGWPKKIAQIQRDLLPVVGEGVTGNPVIGPVSCPNGGDGQKVGVMPDAGPAYLFNPDGSSCYGDSGGKDNPLQTDFAVAAGKYDTPSFPAVGNPAFGDLGPAGNPSFVAPVAGILRALDVAVNEYQGGQDFTGAWDTSSGAFRPGFPASVNDLQFLTGPAVADIDGNPGEEVLEGSASLDFNAFNAAGAPADPGKWPKLSTDWTV